jgi:hypothetical protein
MSRPSKWSVDGDILSLYGDKFAFLYGENTVDYRGWYGVPMVSEPDLEDFKTDGDGPDPETLRDSLEKLTEWKDLPREAAEFEKLFRGDVSTRSRHPGYVGWTPRLSRYLGEKPKLKEEEKAKAREVATRLLRIVLPEGSIQPLLHQEVYLERSNSGLPDLESDQRDLHSLVSEEADILVSKVTAVPEHSASGPWLEYPPALGLRTQEDGGDWAASRPIWMYPLRAKLVEGARQQPLEHAFVANYPRISWQDRDVIADTIQGLLGRRDGFVVGSDASRYDTSVSREIVRACFEAIGDAFDERRLFQWIERYFSESPIVVPVSKDREDPGTLTLEGRSGGVPSGSPFTSLIDSMANIVYSALCAQNYPYEDVICLGDDKVEWTPVDPVTLAKRYHRVGISLKRMWVYSCCDGTITIYTRDGDTTKDTYKIEASWDTDAPCVEYISRLWYINGQHHGVVYRVLNNTIRQERHKDGWLPIDDLGALAQRMEGISMHPGLGACSKVLYDQRAWMTTEYIRDNLALSTERYEERLRRSRPEIAEWFFEDPDILLSEWERLDGT